MARLDDILVQMGPQGASALMFDLERLVVTDCERHQATQRGRAPPLYTIISPMAALMLKSGLAPASR